MALAKIASFLAKAISYNQFLNLQLKLEAIQLMLPTNHWAKNQKDKKKDESKPKS
jgi:hypothetical protein